MRDENRLGVEDDVGAGSGIAGMTDGAVSLQGLEHLLCEDIIEEPQAFMEEDSLPICDGYSSCFLSSMLESEETEIGEACYILTGSIYPENSAAFFHYHIKYYIVFGGKVNRRIKLRGSVSFIADIVTPNTSLRIIPPNHPYSKIFSQKNKLSNIYFRLTSNFIISLSESPINYS
jgi:hypothetical protein